MKKPEPPAGYRMLVEGQDKTNVHDLIWIYDNGNPRWAMSIKQSEEGLQIASDTGILYKEPKSVEDYCFYRCRKIGNEKRI